MSNDPTDEELEQGFKQHQQIKTEIKKAENEYLTLLKQKISRYSHFRHPKLGVLPNSEANKINPTTGKRLGDESED